MVKFEICEFEKVKERICKYYYENDILIDSFFEDHIIESNFYNIIFKEEIIGYCAIYNKSLITSFNLDQQYSHLAQELFMKAKYLEEVSEAFVPTGDEFLLSLCLDNFSRIEKQAYFTRDLDINHGNQTGVNLRMATSSDREIVEKYSEDFFGDIDKYISKECIYIAEKDNELVGFGVIEKGIIRSDLQSIGMFVRREFRRLGIGTNILKELKKIVKSRKKKAISGCWYYNHNSLKTQLKSGSYCETRLLRVKF
ncbi:MULTISPECIES: GNAT family N-acetyltransferase [unclassified Clostridium]|uniref:GNAT family N-acetyltransferase n=1 Tax=unclassified Clostridium TaxID=2614128 RepID=UPI000297EAB8|nr:MULTISPECIES: GNAT family N-acetyltransferase [unclassified Clostridium]EKQ56810.1 MAG: acetyltransferase (GNAT) family protein [Clostridium sp. Maddingley MBC34-26]